MVNYKISGIVTLGFLLVSWVLLTASFTTYTYKLGDSKEIEPQETVYLKFNKVKLEIDGKEQWENDITSGTKAQTALRASLAFAAMSWGLATVSMILIVLNTIGLFSKVKAMSWILKLGPLFATVFCAVALLVVLDMPDALRKDCKNDNIYFIHTSPCADLFEKFKQDNGGWENGPSTTWYLLVVSTFFSLAGSIIGAIFGRYFRE
ncbi:hypothetical protein DLAC_03656 [Tieghemostelium lacteum]|uniref:Transmembrane protein n=1 Tax=Tieghemostelium lacteum TaxID=361077 RepID=A0A152A0E7_TIELA|nr:hypothetical protein DLAC_03656 [Tieghemostelium lacteum]|eukprot:KYQ99717.1 hypothetical protein DLAC_03656 [Tieghemostelium lacteum]